MTTGKITESDKLKSVLSVSQAISSAGMGEEGLCFRLLA